MNGWLVAGGVLAGTFAGLSVLACAVRRESVYADEPEEWNPLEGKRVVFVEDPRDRMNGDGLHGHLEAVGTAAPVPETFYGRVVKRVLDVVLSFAGLVVLSPLMAAVAVAIWVDDPGPVLFAQKRVGRNKRYFRMHKFRSMKMAAPRDVPTRRFGEPDRWITRTGRFIRTTSLDELPQLWDVFIGNMSLVGPRPVVWNEDWLTAERDKRGACGVRPGLTGWAQINGRDRLGAATKARYDGKYAEWLARGGWAAFALDLRCLLGTVFPVVRREDVVEGGGQPGRRERPSIPGGEGRVG